MKSNRSVFAQHPGLDSVIHARTGPLTAELTREPGGFGLGQVPVRTRPDCTTTMVCGFCSTGCGLTVHLKDGQAVNLSADPAYPVNLGMACPKGWEALTPLSAPDRATTPLQRMPDGSWKAIDWQTAMTQFCTQFQRIKGQYGPESCAYLSTGQIATEEMALLGSLWKFGMGFVHCDSNTRQCMATSHVAYKQSFGFDAPPFTYADYEQSDVLVFIGANPCIAHPIMWQRVLRNPDHPTILVVDPRRTETAMAATRHYAIEPKSDLTLLYGLANLLIASGWIDRNYIERHTTDFAKFTEFVSQFTTDRVCAATGISAPDLWQFAQTIAEGKRVSFWWTMGVNQSHEATRTAQAIINLALMTGNIGRPGTGANSITGQCNAMGSRLFANVTSLIGGHDALNPAHREKVSAILGIDESVIPRTPSAPYDEIVDRIRKGEIKGLWVIATNSAHSWVKKNEFREIMGKLEFLVVQDMYPTTDTAQLADLVLPAAGWGEKEGTFINSERRFGVMKRVCRAPGQALADFQIFRLVAEAWGCGGMFADWRTPESAFQIMKRLSAGQPCDITGIENYRMIDECGGIQWPWPASAQAKGTPAPERRLFEDGKYFHPDGRARFIFEAPREVTEKPTSEYPLVMLSGRGSSAQWHTGTRTDKSDVLRRLAPASAYVEVNPTDAETFGIQDQASVRIASRNGSMTAIAVVTPTVRPGNVFVPMHYRGTNELTPAVFDPYSRQPSYKYCPVRIEPILQKSRNGHPRENGR